MIFVTAPQTEENMAKDSDVEPFIDKFLDALGSMKKNTKTYRMASLDEVLDNVRSKYSLEEEEVEEYRVALAVAAESLAARGQIEIWQLYRVSPDLQKRSRDTYYRLPCEDHAVSP